MTLDFRGVFIRFSVCWSAGLILQSQRLMILQLQNGWYFPHILLQPTPAANLSKKMLPQPKQSGRVECINEASGHRIILYCSSPVGVSREQFPLFGLTLQGIFISSIRVHLNVCGDGSAQRMRGMMYNGRSFQRGRMSKTAFQIPVLFCWHRPCLTASGDHWVSWKGC